MSDAIHALAAAVVRSPHWRWMPGMSEHRGWLVLSVLPGGQIDTVFDGCSGEAREPYPDPLPDLQDPGTLGCLLALVREAWGDPEARTTALMIPGRWRVVVHELAGYPRHQWFDAGSEPAALVAALLAAPVAR